jgi:replicative superfamily II helicase
MPDRIVIVDAHRANEAIPTFELKQMMGRVSRGDDTKPGHVDFILGMTKYDKVKARIDANEKNQVVSQLAEDLDVICFYLMPEISNGSVRSIDGVKRWYERSLNSFQGNTVDVPVIVEHLKECQCVIGIGNNILPTVLGQASARFYFRPAHILQWTANF